MKIPPKYPPHQSCELKPGTRLRVVESFSASGVDFPRGEELTFEGEMFAPYDGCDEWIFSLEPGADGTRAEKVICGYEEFSNPPAWLRCFEAIVR